MSAFDDLVELCRKLSDELDHHKAVSEAAIGYIHNLEAGHHGPGGHFTKKALTNLHGEVMAFDEWEQGL